MYARAVVDSKKVDKVPAAAPPNLNDQTPINF
jgi:hypothetical protein